MKLPNIEQAVVPRRKRTEYLLSTTHPRGQTKSAFFAAFGFTGEAWELLSDALTRHARKNDVALTEQTPFGTSYTVDGLLSTPDGWTPMVRVVRFIELEESIPRLVTAFPRKGDRT
jgi:hypothetical protein